MSPRLRLLLDADVIIAGRTSPDGASHAILRMAESGLLEAWIGSTVLTEVCRNLFLKWPRGLPIFEALWPPVLQIGPDPNDQDLTRYVAYAHQKDVDVLAGAFLAQTPWLVTFKVRHFYSPPGLMVRRPGSAIERGRAGIHQLANSAEDGASHRTRHSSET